MEPRGVSRQVRVLVVEDCEPDAELMIAELRSGGFAPGYRRVETEAQYLESLAPDLDVILADYRLPSFGARRALELLASRQLDVPLIVVSGTVSEEVAVDCMKQGAADYLLKDRMARLAPAVSAALEGRRLRAERMAAKKALIESEARYRSLVEGSIQGILVHRDFVIQYASPGMAAIYGCPSAESMVGLDARVFVAPEERARVETYAKARSRGEPAPSRYESRRLRSDGTQIWVESAVSTIEWEGRRATLVTAIDITERKRAEERLRQIDKIEAIGRLAGGIAHDFNNLLTVIAGRIELLRSRTPPHDASRRDIELIQSTTERAAKLTRQLLTFSRHRLLEPKLVSVNRIIDGVEPLLRRLIGEDIELAVRPTENIGCVKIDPGQLEQVIINLALNARDAMPRGGRLTIETSSADLDPAYAAGRDDVRSGRYVVLAVTDTGVGMSMLVQSRLFEPFFTTKDPGHGTGLGLATVHGIVKQAGGHIAVYSELGHGSSFKVYLPDAGVAGGDGSERLPVAVPPARGSERIIVVEDEAELRMLASEVLKTWGYSVLEADGPDTALRLASPPSEKLQLLVTDVVMPGMSGRELADRLLATQPTLRVLFISGYPDSAIVQHGVLKPGSAFLEKPFTPNALLRRVREVLDQ